MKHHIVQLPIHPFLLIIACRKRSCVLGAAHKLKTIKNVNHNSMTHYHCAKEEGMLLQIYLFIY